jgi:transposase-like protein
MNYPKNQIEFEDAFSTEEKCQAALMKLKWPEGFVCPKCKGVQSRRKVRNRMVCVACRHETSLLCDTLFTNTNKTLREWFHALWWIAAQKNGISASGFQNIMGLGCYETAWTWLHKLRNSMARTGLDKLTGSVEVDEAFIGGVQEGTAGRGAGGKVLVVVAAEHRGRKLGRVRLAVIPNASAHSLGTFIQARVAQGSTIITDGWRGYRNIGALGYRHEVDRSEKALPKVHLTISLLKRWMLGTHQGRVSAKYLQCYLNEFVFRFNRRTANSRGLLFASLLELCASGKGITNEELSSQHEPPEVPASQL